MVFVAKLRTKFLRNFSPKIEEVKANKLISAYIREHISIFMAKTKILFIENNHATLLSYPQTL